MARVAFKMRLKAGNEAEYQRRHDDIWPELADDLRQAQHALSEITGAFTADDLLGEIFASFCIGK